MLMTRDITSISSDVGLEGGYDILSEISPPEISILHTQ